MAQLHIVASDLVISTLIEVVKHGGWPAKVSAANSILDRAGHKSIDGLIAELKQSLKPCVQ